MESPKEKLSAASGEVLDHDVGPANVRVYDKNGKVGLVSTNREINQIAFYEIESL